MLKIFLQDHVREFGFIFGIVMFVMDKFQLRPRMTCSSLYGTSTHAEPPRRAEDLVALDDT